MKAKCVKLMFTNYNGEGIYVTEGETINYTVENDAFIIDGVKIKSSAFFYHFKVIEGEEKMSYSDFEYILCNYIFPSAVLFPNEYSGVRHLVIQNWGHSILLTVNKDETVIRVSFENGQEIYSTYEEALDGIEKYLISRIQKNRNEIK